MTTWRWLEKQRPHYWAFGAQHRERLIRRYMTRHHLTDRPLVKDVTDDLLREIQHVRLHFDPLGMDRFAQTEVTEHGIEVTINSRIERMDAVRDVDGVGLVAKWHESIHVAKHVRPIRSMNEPRQGMLLEPGAVTSLILCRRHGPTSGHLSEREYCAENAGLAAAIADADLVRTPYYKFFLEAAGVDAEFSNKVWDYLYHVAEFIGVNSTALCRFFEQHGICRSVRVRGGGRPRVFGIRRPYRGYEWLEQGARPHKLTA